MAGLAKDSVWGSSGMSVSARNGIITIQSMNGSRMQINREQFAAIAEERRQAALNEKFEDKKKQTQRTQRQYDAFFRGGNPNLRTE